MDASTGVCGRRGTRQREEERGSLAESSAVQDEVPVERSVGDFLKIPFNLKILIPQLQ